MIVYKLKYEDYKKAILDLMNKGVLLNSKLDYATYIQAVVFIGKIELTEGTYDEQDRVLTEPTYEDGYFVDVMSSQKIDFGTEGYKNLVFPKNPVHKFAGQ
tara:strand:+ start:2145 stop:2447 length:303 start_codon:yes stop_codon:yes gene_type:complete